MPDALIALALTENLRDGLVFYLILVASLSVHEWAHAFVADKTGDPLPRAQGRVTLNPIAHMDPIGTVILPLGMILLNPTFAILGWGKPVQVSLPNPKTRVRDDLLITGAGPLSNLLLAFSVALLGGLSLRFSPEAIAWKGLFEAVIWINCILFLFNLIPVPPLDGSHFLKHALRIREQAYSEFSRYGFFVILVLINVPQFRERFISLLHSMTTMFGNLL
ncbi:MAG: site-2 protease family protein [Opitutales bacterium]|jgi:Zn-dependent protease